MSFILVVDDDDIIAEHASRILIDGGHACGWVTDTKAARAVIARRRPDLLLLDQNMPGEKGTTLLRWLRNSNIFYDLPVIMLTAVTGVQDEQVAYYVGAQDYVRKPFSDKMLLYRTNQILKSRGTRPGHVPLRDLVEGNYSSASNPAQRRV